MYLRFVLMYTTIIQVRTIRYHQIAEELKGRVMSGAYAAGRLLPSESDMSAEFSVSRVTIRKALEVLVDENMAENAEIMGELFRKELRALNSPFIKLVRGKGLLNAIVINHKDPEAAWQLCEIFRDNGLITKPTHGDKIRLAPPLIINETQIHEAVRIIEKSLNSLEFKV